MTTRISYAIALLTGMGLVFIGTRFIVAPEVAEAGYGIHFDEQGDYSFHYIKGIRDLFAGLTICLLTISRQRLALALTLLAGAIIPIADMVVVLSKNYNSILQAMPHVIALIICITIGVILLITKKPQQKNKNAQGFIKLISSADSNNESVIELNILPGEKTPKHYHILFAETFEVLKGTLKVGKNKEIHTLKQGDIVTINPYETHFYNNISKQECIIKVTINPGNKNFEDSLFIFKGLANDGLASKAGTPRKLSDLALFVYLNNSKMVGFQKIAEPLFNYLARKAIKKGRLEELKGSYGVHQEPSAKLQLQSAEDGAR